jgi:hypothetical protein
MKPMYSIIRLPITMLCSLFFLTPLTGLAEWISLVPSEYGQSRVFSISDHEHTYFSIEKGNQLSIQVKGPSQIRILTRREFAAQPNQSVEYTIRYTMDSQVSERLNFTARPIDTARDLENPERLLGYLRKHSIDVPRGVHSYSFEIVDDSPRIWVRVQEQQTSYIENLRRIAIQPHQYTTAVDLDVKERIYTYYRIGNSDEIRLDVIGPTNLKILARLEYDNTMRGDQKYRFQVLEGDSVVETYSLSTKLSDVAKYIEPAYTLLSQGEKVYLDVPEGRHSYRVVLLDNHRSMLIKFLIPVKDLGNES